MDKYSSANYYLNKFYQATSAIVFNILHISMVGRNSVIDRKVTQHNRRQINKWVINIIKGMDKGTVGGSKFFTIRIERKHRPPLILRVHRNRLYVNTKNHHKSHSTKTAGTKNGRLGKSKPYMHGRKGKNNPELNSSNSASSSGESSRSGITNGRDNVTNSMLEASKRSLGRRNGGGNNGSEDGSDESSSKMDWSSRRHLTSGGGGNTAGRADGSDSEQGGANGGRNAMNGKAGASWTVDSKKEYWSSRYGGKGGGGGNIAERDEGNLNDDDGTDGERNGRFAGQRDRNECNCRREHCRCAGTRQIMERNSAKVQRFLPRYGLGEWGNRRENIDGTFKMEYSSPKHWGGHIMNDWDIEKSPDDELANLKPEFITIINGVRIIGKVDEVGDASKFRPEFSTPLNNGGSKMEAKNDVSVIDLNSESSLFRNYGNDDREDRNVTNNTFKQENGRNIERRDVKIPLPNFRNGDRESGKVDGNDGGGNEINLQLGPSPVENEFLSLRNGSREGGNLEAKNDRSIINLKSDSSPSSRNGRRHRVKIEKRKDVTNSNRDGSSGGNIEGSKIQIVINSRNGCREGGSIANGSGNVKEGENETNNKSFEADLPANESREDGNDNGGKEDGNVLNSKLESSSTQNGISNEGRNIVNSESESSKLKIVEGSGSGKFDGRDGGNVSGSKIESSQTRDRVGGDEMNLKLESSSAQNRSSEGYNVVNSKSESPKLKTERSGNGKFDGRGGGNVSVTKIESSQIRNRDGGNKINSKLDSSSAQIGTSEGGIVSEREGGNKTSSKLEPLSAIKATNSDIVNERHRGNKTSSKNPKLESSTIKNGSSGGVKTDRSDGGNGTQLKLMESSSSGNEASKGSITDAGMDGGNSESLSISNEERGSRSIDREDRNVTFKLKLKSSSSKNGKKGGGHIDRTGRNETNTKLESSTTQIDGKKAERNAKTKQRFFMPRFTIKMVKSKNAHRSTCGCEKLRCKGGVLEPKPKVQLVFRKMSGGGKNIRGNVKTTSKRVSDAVPRNSNIERPSVSKVRPSTISRRLTTSLSMMPN